MSSLAVARHAIVAEIKRLVSDRNRLEAALRIIDARGETVAVPKAAKAAKRRLRIKDDVSADLTSKVIKAVQAHRDGASRKSILTYLSRNGYEVGHHFNEPHLTKIVNSLLSGDTPSIRRQGDKGTARYFTV